MPPQSGHWLPGAGNMKNTDQALGVQCTCMHGHGWETGGRSLRGRIHSEAFHTGHASSSQRSCPTTQRGISSRVRLGSTGPPPGRCSGYSWCGPGSPHCLLRTQSSHRCHRLPPAWGFGCSVGPVGRMGYQGKQSRQERRWFTCLSLLAGTPGQMVPKLLTASLPKCD